LKHRTINILSISEAVESCKKKLQKLQKLALLMTIREHWNKDLFGILQLFCVWKLPFCGHRELNFYH